MSVRAIVVFVLAVGVMVGAGAAFANKMFDFVLTMSGDEVAGFGVVAVATYLAGMIPIACLMLWAVFTGRFRDIEGPARRMLELDREIEREEESHAR